jgi:hypothetical protein
MTLIPVIVPSDTSYYCMPIIKGFKVMEEDESSEIIHDWKDCYSEATGHYTVDETPCKTISGTIRIKVLIRPDMCDPHVSLLDDLDGSMDWVEIGPNPEYKWRVLSIRSSRSNRWGVAEMVAEWTYDEPIDDFVEPDYF